MSDLIEPSDLSPDQIESIEKLSMRLVFRALVDHAQVVWEEFRQSPDDADGIAEDVTREALARFPGFPLHTRMYGRIDYRRAGYQILPCFVTRQALLVDSKAEKSDNSATLQTNQTSLPLTHVRAGKTVDVKGSLDEVLKAGDSAFLTTTIFAHYHYDGDTCPRVLKSITIAALPNRRLSAAYVVSPTDTIWIAGRNAPTLGEDLRVRLAFSRLKAKCAWRVQKLPFNQTGPDWSRGHAPWTE
ncbi:MAG: SfiI family type II restriction endonuclease [Phycisphaerae bacterium]|nr:SfiI family type II restriction endonuclease [Phycisphaerae bacterium]